MIGTYAWLPAIEGAMTIKGNTMKIDEKLIDLIKNVVDMIMHDPQLGFGLTF